MRLFYQYCMTQKNQHLQLNLSKFQNKNYASRPICKSMIACKYSETCRSDRYIPIEFRKKRFPESALSFYPKQFPDRNHQSFIHNPFKKNRFDAPRPSIVVQPSQKDTESIVVKSQAAQKSLKFLSLRAINAELPKLRQTNSTLCQSWKTMPQQPHSRLSEFKRLRLLGKGKFGDVYLVKHTISGFVAALKIIRKADLLSCSKEQNEKAIGQLAREIKIQAYLSHPNLIELYDFFSDSQSVYLLLELACDGHLYDLLSSHPSLSEDATSIIVRQIVEGVDYMHKRDIIHRDIKLQNIVLSHGMAKICDFGWSVHCPKQFRSTLCGTPLYISPEILIGQQYNKKIDTWAIGALTHELFTKDNPFKIKNKDDLSRIVTEDFEMEQGSPELRSFVTFILRKNPIKRPDCDTILRHPFIEKYKDLETSEELAYLAHKTNKQQ